MDILFGKQVQIEDLNNLYIDLFLFAGNHELRKLTSWEEFSKVSKINKSIMLCYTKTIFDEEIPNLDKRLISSHEEIFKILDELFLSKKNEKINIVVDYSCMTKSWYYSIILYLKNKKIDVEEVDVYFSYTPSKYSKPKSPKPNSEIAPLPGKYVVPTDKPKALIVCLGYEQSKAEGIIDHLDPKVAYIFYTNPALDEEFVKTLEENNKNILNDNTKSVIAYPFNNLLFLENQLTLLYHKLKDNYSIIIAPLGPKPFTLISMLMAAQFNDIDIWRVGSGPEFNEYEREPFENRQLIINRVVFGAKFRKS